MRILGRLELYVLRRTLLSVGGVLALLGAVIMLIDFVELTRTVGSQEGVSVASILGMMFLKSPAVVVILFPFIFLFGVLAAFVNLNRRSELVAMRAAGVSAWRFIFPAAGAALVVGILTTTVLNPVTSALNQAYEDRKAEIEGRSKAGEGEVWLRQGSGDTQVVIRAGSLDDTGRVLKKVSLFVYTLDGQGAPTFSRRIDADEARLMTGHWRLTGVRESTPGQAAVRHEALSIPSNLDPETALQRFGSANSMAFWDLPGMIERTEAAGFSATAYHLRFHRLLATPLMLAAMAVLAAAFSLRLLRLGDFALLAGAGVALGFLFFFINELCGALGSADIIPAPLAAWAPPLLALLSGFTLLCYTEDG